MNQVRSPQKAPAAAILDADPQALVTLQWRELAVRDDAVAVIDAVDGLAAKVDRVAKSFVNLVLDCPPS